MPNILIVEDNEMNRDMLSRRLTKKGYDISLAVDGQEGIDMAIEGQPDLILLDMGLPIKDGWQVAGELKAHDVAKNIPIIALTAHAMDGDREKTLAAGCDEYDTKPIDLKRLLAKMKALLPDD